MICNSPRANAGFRMFAVSRLPCVAPAPTMVCISSMNIIVSCALHISSSSCCIRSSNSPRYFVPATSAVMSSEKSRLLRIVCGTLPEAMRSANPSTIALLPTPASPMRIGLFFLRRARICITRSISLSRPITGSIFPACANFVRSVPNFSRVVLFFVVDSSLRASVMAYCMGDCIPSLVSFISRITEAMVCAEMPYCASTCDVAVVVSATMSHRICDVEMWRAVRCLRSMLCL